MKIGLSAIGFVVAAGILVGGSCGRSGCVQFDAQTIRLRVDSSRDRADALLIDRDLTSDSTDVSGAVEQLEKVRDSSKSFALFGNFPFAFNFDELPPDKPMTPAEQAFWDVLARNIAVTNGSLWRDAAGRLCGSQLVRLTRLADVLAAGDALIVEKSREELQRLTSPPSEHSHQAARNADPLWAWLDADALERLLRAADSGHRFLSLRGGALVLSLPLDEACQRRLRQALISEMRNKHEGSATASDAGATSDASAASNAALATDDQGWLVLPNGHESRIALRSTGDGMEIAVGDPAEAELHVEVAPGGRKGTDLGDALAARGWFIGGPDSETQALAAFEAFCQQR